MSSSHHSSEEFDDDDNDDEDDGSFDDDNDEHDDDEAVERQRQRPSVRETNDEEEEGSNYSEDESRSYYSDEDGSRSYYSGEDEDGSRRSYDSDERSRSFSRSEGGEPSFGDSFAHDGGGGGGGGGDDDQDSYDPNHHESFHESSGHEQTAGEGGESVARSSQRSGQRSFQEEDRSADEERGHDSYQSQEGERSFYSDEEDRSRYSDERSYYSDERSSYDSQQEDNRSYDSQEGSYQSDGDSRSHVDDRSSQSGDESYRSNEESFIDVDQDDNHKTNPNAPRDPEAPVVDGNSYYSDDGYTDQDSKHRSFDSSGFGSSAFESSAFEASFADDADDAEPSLPPPSKHGAGSQEGSVHDNRDDSFAAAAAAAAEDPPTQSQVPVHDDDAGSHSQSHTDDNDDRSYYNSGDDQSYSDRSGSYDSREEAGSFRGEEERSGSVDGDSYQSDDRSTSSRSDNESRFENCEAQGDPPENQFPEDSLDKNDQTFGFDDGFDAFGDNGRVDSFGKQDFASDPFQSGGGEVKVNIGTTAENFDGNDQAFGAFEAKTPEFEEDPFQAPSAGSNNGELGDAFATFGSTAPFEDKSTLGKNGDIRTVEAGHPDEGFGDAPPMSRNEHSESAQEEDNVSVSRDESDEEDDDDSLSDGEGSESSSARDDSSRKSADGSEREIEAPLPGSSAITFSIKEPIPGKKTLIILCTMFPNSENEAQDQDRAMKLCKSQGIIPTIIMGQQKPPQRDELVSISKAAVFPQFFLYYRQHVEFIGDFGAIEEMVEYDEFHTGMLDPHSFHSDAQEEHSEDVSQSGSASGQESFSAEDKSVLDQSNHSEFSQSHEDSRSTFTGRENSFADSLLDNSKSGADVSQNVHPDESMRGSESKHADDLLPQDESLRSDFKKYEQQDESLRSKLSAEREGSDSGSVEGSEEDFDSGDSRSEASEEFSEEHSAGSQSFGSEPSYPDESTQRDESMSLHREISAEVSEGENSAGSRERGEGGSRMNSPSIDARSISLRSKEAKTEDFENSMMIGEVFGQPNELFEDFKEKEKMVRVGEEDGEDSDGKDETHDSGSVDESAADRDVSEAEETQASLSLNQLQSPEGGAISTVKESEQNEVSESAEESAGEQPRPSSPLKASPVRDKVVKKKRKKKRNKRRKEAKSPALLDFAANVNDAMLDLEEQEELNDQNVDSSAHRLLHGFDALLGIFLQLSDELELISTVATSKKKKDKDTMAPVQALKAVLSFADTFDQLFDDLKPIILDCFEEEPDEEMDELLYRLNSLVDLLCETTHRAGERQEWNERAETTYVTLLELMERDALDLRCYFDDVETPDQGLSANIHEAWSATGHIEELRALQYAEDPWIFRQICYEVMVSTDQWCPDTSMLMEICGIDPEMLEEEPDPEYLEEEEIAPIPQAAEHVLDKVNGDPLPRPTVLASILRRIIPPRAVTDATLLDHFTSIRNTLDSPLGLSATNIVSISSIPETINDPESLGVGGMGKTTLAAMVAQHPDVRRYFIDGVVWVYVGDKELNYARYTQCLRELVAQLDFYQG
jgi:hypothetical protein